MTDTTRLFFKHFLVALGGLGYVSSMLLLGYQYLGLKLDLPGVFLTRVEHGDGWWLDVDWGHPVLWGWVALVAAAALVYAFKRRADTRPYRDPEARSQSGF